MSDKNEKDASLVEQYKAAAALRLAERRARSKEPPVRPDGARGDLITIRFARDAQPLSAFGGITEVLGPSRIQIPEYKRQRS